jgi:hypothetical protein
MLQGDKLQSPPAFKARSDKEEDIMNVYELVLDLNKQKTAPSKGKKPVYLKVQEILKNCSGSLSEDISLMRKDRL